MDMRKAITMIGHITEYIVDNQEDHEYAELENEIDILKGNNKPKSIYDQVVGMIDA